MKTCDDSEDVETLHSEVLNGWSGRLPRVLAWASLGDAVSVPMHWYYDLAQLWLDYPLTARERRGEIEIQSVRQDISHPDSWDYFRTTEPHDAWAHPLDLFHDRARFYGLEGSHYHGCLRPGEVTLTMRLSCELFRSIQSQNQAYNTLDYLRRYQRILLEPGQHHDTYIESAHRAFMRARAHAIDPAVIPRGDRDGDCLAGLVLALPLLVRGSIKGTSHEQKGSKEPKVYTAKQWIARTTKEPAPQLSFMSNSNRDQQSIILSDEDLSSKLVLKGQPDSITWNNFESEESRAFTGDAWTIRRCPELWYPLLQHISLTHSNWRVLTAAHLLAQLFGHSLNKEGVINAIVELERVCHSEQCLTATVIRKQIRRDVQCCALSMRTMDIAGVDECLRSSLLGGPRWNR
mmetsp:Transcript_1668/g.3921  ORF Transcript_1668/g.3921 Transcript_1668/m.3921 type:complete len:404 (+) Transcript_1668:32-1243(+)